MSNSLKIHIMASFCLYIADNVSVIFHAPRGPAHNTLTAAMQNPPHT